MWIPECRESRQNFCQCMNAPFVMGNKTLVNKKNECAKHWEVRFLWSPTLPLFGKPTMRLCTMCRLLGWFFLMVQFGKGENDVGMRAGGSLERGKWDQHPFSSPLCWPGQCNSSFCPNVGTVNLLKACAIISWPRWGRKWSYFCSEKITFLSYPLCGHRHEGGSACSSAYADFLLLIIYRSPGVYVERQTHKNQAGTSCELLPIQVFKQEMWKRSIWRRNVLIQKE